MNKQVTRPKKPKLEIDEVLWVNATIPPNLEHPELKTKLPAPHGSFESVKAAFSARQHQDLFSSLNNCHLLSEMLKKQVTRPRKRKFEIDEALGENATIPPNVEHPEMKTIFSDLLRSWHSSRLLMARMIKQFTGPKERKLEIDEALGENATIPSNLEHPEMKTKFSGSWHLNPNSRGNFKKIFDDGLTQTMMEIYCQKMKSVGAIMYSGKVRGTGFRVGTKYIATTWHVISDIIDPTKRGEEIIKNLLQTFIIFTDSPYDPSANKYFFSAHIHYHNRSMDVAIVEVANIDGSLPKNLTLRKENFCLADASTVSVIGYGHPRNPNKNFEYRCPVVASDSHEMKEAQEYVKQMQTYLKHGLMQGQSFSIVDKGYHGFDDPYKIFIHIFMEHGSSGSPILACINPSEGIVEVVGMVTHAIPEFFFCLKDENRGLIPHQYRFEGGVRIEYIHKDMKSDLARDLFCLNKI